MKHTLRVEKLASLRPSEAAMSLCDASEKVKTAARAYVAAVAVPEGAQLTPGMKPGAQVRAIDFSDESEEGKALLEAARSYSLWFDAAAHVRAKNK